MPGAPGHPYSHDAIVPPAPLASFVNPASYVFQQPAPKIPAPLMADAYHSGLSHSNPFMPADQQPSQQQQQQRLPLFAGPASSVTPRFAMPAGAGSGAVAAAGAASGVPLPRSGDSEIQYLMHRFWSFGQQMPSMRARPSGILP